MSISMIPDDVLADVFRRVAPRSLAVCRCVSRAWRALIDDRRLLLPRSLAGLFINMEPLDKPEFFVRPAADSASGYRMPCYGMIDDHCNGLILQHELVTNPATGQAVRLPDRPPLPLLDSKRFAERRYLVFDPAESPHYQVFLIPYLLYDYGGYSRRSSTVVDHAHDALMQLEWPPSPFVLGVFSSRTGRWEERISLSEGDHTYRMIKPPRGVVTLEDRRRLYVGRSEKGVYCAFIDGMSHVWVWILIDGSCDQTEWVLTHHSAYGLALPTSQCDQESNGPWILADVNKRGGRRWTNEVLMLRKDQFEWDSDDDGSTQDRVQQRLNFRIIGFHPYKELVFLTNNWPSPCLAYHLKSSKLEYLGQLLPMGSYPYGWLEVESAFPYTPCWMGGLVEF
ncbi:hypothetical protein BS78_01G224500 [Paspalum vaginatum]|nr:hypothetical protein BS78_01G224500 [Paspalum vaginatum]